MNEFELRRLRQEGKDVILPGGRRALAVLEAKLFKEAEARIDKAFEDRQDLIELADMHGRSATILLGC